MRIASVLKSTLLIIGATYLLIVVAGYLGQRHLLYFPDPTRTPPARVGLADVHERIFDTPDGQKIINWYGKAKPGRQTLLFYHGNGGSLADRALLMRKYLDHGYGMLMMSYRGFSGSTGSPSEAANVADAKLAYDLLIKEGVKPDRIVIYGKSLGTGVALQIAREKAVAGVILDSPFTSVVDRAAEIYFWLPVRWLVTDRYESSRHVRDLRVPLLIVHGEADDVVPVAMGRQLYAIAPDPKEIVTLAGAGHNNHDLYGSFEAVSSWLKRLSAGAIKR